MNMGQHELDTDAYGLCSGVQNMVHIEIGMNGYSLCRADHAVVGDCLIEGIQDFGVAHELTEMLIGELEDKALQAQQTRGMVFG